MNPKGTEEYANKVKEVLNKAEYMQGCKNRMCITDDPDELMCIYTHLTLFAADLYRLNCERLQIIESFKENPPMP